MGRMSLEHNRGCQDLYRLSQVPRDTSEEDVRPLTTQWGLTVLLTPGGRLRPQNTDPRMLFPTLFLNSVIMYRWSLTHMSPSIDFGSVQGRHSDFELLGEPVVLVCDFNTTQGILSSAFPCPKCTRIRIDWLQGMFHSSNNRAILRKRSIIRSDRERLMASDWQKKMSTTRHVYGVSVGLSSDHRFLNSVRHHLVIPVTPRLGQWWVESTAVSFY